MPLTDQDRIAAEQKSPRIVALWRALTALRSVVSFMNTGAHPDDETSAMLAALRFRDGIDVSYACSTRGEGGQNDIGTETTAALGTLRTAEMEAACDVLDLRMYWLGTAPEDPIFDFGFSKSGVETLAHWGRDRTLARFVEIIRTERPDIICPTFLDIPGQHGHHRAMTQAAHAVMALAADPGFEGSGLPVWQVSKMYLPAWSGAGQAYDDDEPPPPATLVIPARGRDPVTGWSYAHIGQQSRAAHRTQAMGRWVRPGEETDFPLHLAQSHVQGPDTDLTSGLPRTLRDLAVPAIAADLEAAQAAAEQAIAAFPDARAVLALACEALVALRRARDRCPQADLPRIEPKLDRKDTQLCTVIRLASGVSVRAWVAEDRLRPCLSTALTQELDAGAAEVRVTPQLPDGWTLDGGVIALSETAAISDPYPPVYLPGQPVPPCLSVAVTAHGVTAKSAVPLEVAPVVVPSHAATLSPVADMINLATARRRLRVDLSDVGPAGAVPALAVPEGWTATRTDAGFDVTAPDDAAPGLYELTLTLDGAPAFSVQDIAYPHVAPRALCRPARILVRVVEAALPEARVAYIGGGNDRVAHWLERMGADVTDLSAVDLTEALLAGFDTIVIGIFAMKFRPGLAEAMPRLHGWARAGGTLVTLYHRPWDNWDAARTAPYRLEIGQPSLRWRVTDAAAEVAALDPGHPVMTTPNPIGPEDWAGWHKERGLYFAKSWDAAYTPLLSMHDPEEAPLTGALLVAEVGAGRHIHTALILHHQMEQLTAGAFRLMANLLNRAG